MTQLTESLNSCVSSKGSESCSDQQVDVICKSFIKFGQASKDGEGDSTLLEDEEQESLDGTTEGLRRVLQSGFNYNGGVAIESDSSNTAVGGDLMLYTTTNIVPDTEVDTTSAFSKLLKNASLMSALILLLSI